MKCSRCDITCNPDTAQVVCLECLSWYVGCLSLTKFVVAQHDLSINATISYWERKNQGWIKIHGNAIESRDAELMILSGVLKYSIPGEVQRLFPTNEDTVKWLNRLLGNVG